MQITVNLPDEIARQLASSDKNPERVALEALALEGYRSRSLSESAVRRMLGFESRMDVHEFLKQHGSMCNTGSPIWKKTKQHFAACTRNF
jgi:hypothetical protein